MRVLLIQPRQRPGIGFKRLAVTEPLALEIVAACLMPPHEVRILDLFSFEELLPTLSSYQPDACGISCSFTVDESSTLSIARAIKEARPECFVFVGGHHASLSPGNFLRGSIDAVVLGEGELTAPELLDCQQRGGDLMSVKGLALNRGAQECRTAERELVADLESLPFPARQLTRQSRKRYYLGLERPTRVVQSARGCPHRCSFCSVWRFYRKRVRMRRPATVVAEVASIDEGNILFADDNFFLDIKRAMKMAEMIQERGIRKHFYIQARSDTIVEHPELIAQWKRVGLSGVFIGFEKLTEEELRGVNKRNSVKNNDASLGILRAYHIGVMPSFIVDPGYGLEEFARLRDYVRRWRLGTPSFTILTPLPGTEMAHELRNKLISTNCELFDLLHTVLPTRLNLSDFYGEFARLYASAIPYSDIGWRNIIEVLSRMFRGRLSLAHLKTLRDAAMMLGDPASYLKEHERGLAKVPATREAL